MCADVKASAALMVAVEAAVERLFTIAIARITVAVVLVVAAQSA